MVFLPTFVFGFGVNLALAPVLHFSMLSSQAVTLSLCPSQSLSLSMVWKSYTWLSVVPYDSEGQAGKGMPMCRSAFLDQGSFDYLV